MGGQRKPKTATPSRHTFTFHADLPPLGLDQPFGNGQAQTGTALFAGAGLIGPPEAVKHVGQVGGGDAGAGIGDGDANEGSGVGGRGSGVGR